MTAKYFNNEEPHVLHAPSAASEVNRPVNETALTKLNRSSQKEDKGKTRPQLDTTQARPPSRSTLITCQATFLHAASGGGGGGRRGLIT